MPEKVHKDGEGIMKKTIEGSIGIAQAVRDCEPDVIACYPITPSTHIAEELDRMYTDGEVKSFIAVESEFSAISALVGGSAAGGRTFSTTSSQGLALMHEVLFTAAGMRLPIVMCVANRALSAPLNIWCDQQDSVSERDAGWLQLYCESNQEAVDSIPQAYKITEKSMLPAMVCVDGFYLTHAVEQIDVPDKKQIAKFLPPYRPPFRLDPKKPLSFGEYAAPEHYQSFREDISKDIHKAKEEIRRANDGWGKITGRRYGNGLWEEYRCNDADYVLVAMGSFAGNAKVAADEMRKDKKKVGVLRIRSFRPFPYELGDVLAGKKGVGVFDRALSLGGVAPLFADVSASLYDSGEKPILSSFVGGLGGRDVTVSHAKNMFGKIMKGKKVSMFIE
jgi:pyruvate ferredoxin oxidoreductase alpha subunit